MRVIDLGGSWAIRSLDGKYSLEGPVPGTLFQALEARGDFGPEGIGFRENNRACVAIADRAFSYSRDFELDGGFMSAPGCPVYLEADGLDTLATIRLNGQVVASTANMHRRFRFDVSALLRAGRNSLEIEFGNALEACRNFSREKGIWHVYNETPEIGYPGFNALRKSHCSFGWDWGPIVPDLGVWRPIRLVRYELGRIASLRVTQELGGLGGASPSASVLISPEVEGFNGEKAMDNLEVEVEVSGPSIKGSLSARGPAGSALRVDIPSPELWWPNGMGAQGLYRVEARLVVAAGANTAAGAKAAVAAAGKTIDSRALRLGLRKMELRRDKDEWGEGFCFAVNGVSVFARGADYIPEDICLARVTPERTRRLLEDAARSNFNCVRVWGGGVYPSEAFYDACDELGLVVWQDLMFACAMYDSGNEAFLEETAAEVRDNLERIRHRACLGLVCGNNEMETGVVYWGFNPSEEEKKGYLRQYEEVYARVHAQTCPEVAYWPSSPSSGGNFDEPNSPDRGDCHYWDVWHGNKDFSDFQRHYFRFMSEFGFESFPSMKTVRGFARGDDLNLTSPVMEDHQRCVGGNGKVMNYVSRYFRFPKGFDEIVYLSQVSQADALRHGIEHWRRNRGRCMGAVYWQLNDNWPVASWSSIDSEGRWKALQYQARRSFAPILVSSVQPPQWRKGLELLDPSLPEGNGHFSVFPAKVEFHLSNETAERVAGELSWSLMELGGKAIESGVCTVCADPWSSALSLSLDFSDRVRGRLAPRNHFVAWKATVEGKRFWGYQAFTPYKQLELSRARVAATLSEDGKWVELRSDAPAFFAEADHPELDLFLSDNFVFLDGREPRRLQVERVTRGDQELKVGDKATNALVADGLFARSLSDSY
jgi:beta-mannosidase